MLNKQNLRYLEKEKLPLSLEKGTYVVTAVKQCLQFRQAAGG